MREADAPQVFEAAGEQGPRMGFFLGYKPEQLPGASEPGSVRKGQARELSRG
jgi:hypothetical protein